MKVLFFGRKPVSVDCLSFLLTVGMEVVCVCGVASKDVWWSPRLESFCRERDIAFCCLDNMNEVKEFASDGVDYLFSVLFPKRIPLEILRLARYGAINFHPAPLPGFRGVGGYNFAILEGLATWKVTAHFMEKEIDTGDIIMDKEFPIDVERETAFSLEKKSQHYLYDLFKSVVRIILSGQTIPRTPQGKGRYISKEEFERAREITTEDPPQLIERKIRAFWFPPYPGAFVRIGEREYTLVNDYILKQLFFYYHNHDNLP